MRGCTQPSPIQSAILLLSYMPEREKAPGAQAALGNNPAEKHRDTCKAADRNEFIRLFITQQRCTKETSKATNQKRQICRVQQEPRLRRKAAHPAQERHLLPQHPKSHLVTARHAPSYKTPMSAAAPTCRYQGLIEPTLSDSPHPGTLAAPR